jgi:hypothetical protein
MVSKAIYEQNHTNALFWKARKENIFPGWTVDSVRSEERNKLSGGFPGKLGFRV